MRKILLLIATVVVMGACSKDETPSLKINKSEVKLKYDDEFTFSIENASSVEWSSSDEFVGTIADDGKFKASHIGETTVTGNVEGTSVTAKVIIEPYITDITEPSISFGENVKSIKEFEKRTLIEETTDILLFKGEGNKENEVVYLFDDNKMKSSVLSFKVYSNLSEDLAKFYSERYRYLGSDESILFFESKDESYGLGISVNATFGMHAMYIESPSTTSAVLKNNITSMMKDKESSNEIYDIIKIIEK